MKALNPAIREKKRYLKLKGQNLDKNVDKAILEFIGSLGRAKASPKFIKKNKTSAILAINRDSLRYVRASFVAFSGVIEVIKVSGTLKGLGKN
jgi:RNase P/RNase MRP subunit POP5